MINLSNGGANEDGIFLHADVKGRASSVLDWEPEQKRENNPMHSSRGERKQRFAHYPK
jgi:hypothetical protein